MALDPPVRKRGRPSNASRGISSATAKQPSNRGRQRLTADPNEPVPVRKRKSGSGNATKDGPTKRKRAPQRESWGSSGSVRRREYEDEELDEDDDQDRTQRPNKRGRLSNASRRSSGAPVIGRRGVPQPKQPGSLGPDAAKRRSGQRPDHDKDDEERSNRASSAPPSPPKPYVHVAPHTRRVRQSAIEAKWTPLTGASLSAVSSTLQHAQRPILQRLSDSQMRRTHSSSALRLITHRIDRKISRGLPFPPASMPAPVGRAPLQSDGGREVELNFESVLDGKLNLERQLEPALDGLEVLQREKENLEEELDHDYATLRNLEAGARAQAREQRSLLKKAHILTPAPSKMKLAEEGERQDDRREKSSDFVFHRDSITATGDAFSGISNDQDVQSIAIQLGDHVDSIRANLEQTAGILPQLTRGRAALRAVLLRYLDQRQYEHAVLG